MRWDLVAAQSSLCSVQELARDIDNNDDDNDDGDDDEDDDDVLTPLCPGAGPGAHPGDAEAAPLPPPASWRDQAPVHPGAQCGLLPSQEPSKGGVVMTLTPADMLLQEDPWSADLHALIDGVIGRANTLLVNKTGRPLPLEKYEYHQAFRRAWRDEESIDSGSQKNQVKVK